MNIKDLRIQTQMTQQEFADYFNIPKRTIENWEGEQRTPPAYVLELIKYKIKKEKLNMRKLVELNEGERIELFTGDLVSMVSYLKTHPNVWEWMNDNERDTEALMGADSYKASIVELDLEDVETWDDLEYAIDEISLSWWTLKIEQAALSFEKFSELLMGGPSRYSEAGISYVLVKDEDGEEVFYAEWEVPEDEDEEAYDDQQLEEPYQAYTDGEREYIGK